MSEPQSPISFTEHGIPIRNIWHMLLYAWNEPLLTPQVSQGDVENAPTLDALFATVLIKMIQQRMRIGLGRGYVPASKTLRAVRGRVNFAESMKRQTFDHGEVNCDFQEYSVNEPRNQILRSTLTRLIQAGELGPSPTEAEELRQQMRWLVRNLGGVNIVELDLEFIRRQVLAHTLPKGMSGGGNENDYRLMLSICEMIVMRQMPLEEDGTKVVPTVDQKALILHRVYERFVANFYKMQLKGWDVSAQKRLDWHTQDANEHLPMMIPDLILQEHKTGRVLIMDTKFTAGSLVENRWGKPIYDSSHLYQLYAYLRSQDQVSDEYRRAQGILLYPAVQSRLAERVELQGHIIRIESVDLAAAWEEVERQLLNLVDQGSKSI
jgi:5-methylcytosine-specific restriction enzyme subunit McrC